MEPDKLSYIAEKARESRQHQQIADAKMLKCSPSPDPLYFSSHVRAFNVASKSVTNLSLLALPRVMNFRY